MREQWTQSDDGGLRGDNYSTHSDRKINPFLDGLRSPWSLTKFRSYLKEDLLYFSQLVRRFVARILNTSDLYTIRERFLFSGLAMLIGFAILWMSFIFAILSGSNLILKLSIVALRRCGRSARRAWQSIQS